MTDREMLELAAKAAGLTITNWVATCPRVEKYQAKYGCNLVAPWNPLADDGDALRLAVVLGIQIHLEGGENDDEAVWANEVMLWTDGDRQAATRRSIVRCAAEIGRTM